MSQKGKPLNYESNEPAFLRRLRGEIGGQESPRQDRPQSISKRLQKDVEDDEPTFVLEGTNDTISKLEYDALSRQRELSTSSQHRGLFSDGSSQKPTNQPIPACEEICSTSRKQVVEAGKTAMKRKVVKVIGNSENNDTLHPAESSSQVQPPLKSSKPKRKHIKLSFDED